MGTCYYTISVEIEYKIYNNRNASWTGIGGKTGSKIVKLVCYDIKNNKM